MIPSQVKSPSSYSDSTFWITYRLSFPRASLVPSISCTTSRTATRDSFSPHTLLTLGSCLAQPLSILFEYMFSYNHIPAEWKHSFLNLNPIHKKGFSTDAGSRRIIHQQLSLYLSNNSLMLSSQHGSQSGKSTINKFT